MISYKDCINLAHPLANHRHLLEGEDRLFSRRFPVRRFARVHHELGRWRRRRGHRRRRRVTLLRRHLFSDELPTTAQTLQLVAEVIGDLGGCQRCFAECRWGRRRRERDVSEKIRWKTEKGSSQLLGFPTKYSSASWKFMTKHYNS